MANQYGVLAQTVAGAGSLMAATTAISLAWRGKAAQSWDPDDQELPQAAQKVAGVLSAAAIAYEWATLRSSAHATTLNRLLLLFGVLTVLFLLGYSFIKGTQTVQAIRVTADGNTETVDVIGGFRLKPRALELRDKENKTIQDIYASALYDPDRVWTRTSRQLAKTCLLTGYMGLLVFGTLLLATAALRVASAVS